MSEPGPNPRAEVPPGQEMVTVQFSIGIGDGKFNASAAVPVGPTNLTQILPVLQWLDSSLIDGIAAQAAAQGYPVSCKAGCGACCRQMVPISIFEAEALGAWIRTLPEPFRQELTRRFQEAVLKLTAAGIVDRMLETDWQSEAGRKLALEYFYQGVPCPFLEDESCSIHPIRPLICREYLVTSPAAHCADPANLQTVHVRMPLNFSRVLSAIGAEIENNSRGWIPLIFLLNWMESGAHPGDSMAGTGPDVLHEFVKRLGNARSPAQNTEPSGTSEVPSTPVTP